MKFVLSFAALSLFAGASFAQPSPFSVSAFIPSLPSELCKNGECAPVITQTTYQGRAAYRLTDGKNDAVVVPSIGRVMRYGRVGGPNLMWNAPTGKSLDGGGWTNYGGDKTWLAPQTYWGVFHGAKNWPPDPAFDGKPHESEVLVGGKLKLVSPVSPTIGIRVERVMGFNEQGEFEVAQTAVKTAGGPVRVGLWSISQAVPAQAVFLPTSPSSAYKDNFLWLGRPAPDIVSQRDGVLRAIPRPTGGGIKIGVDSKVSALASVLDGLAWVQKSALPKGQYPDGADGAGFPVELYINGNKDTFYTELELLGPLVNMVKGQKMTHTVRWSLHEMPSKDALDDATHQAVAALLK